MLLPLSFFIASCYRFFNFWAIRKKAFARISKTKIYQGFGSVSVQIIMGAFNIAPLGLLLGHITGLAAGTTTLMTLFNRDYWKENRKIKFQQISKLIKRYRNFPLYSSWAGIVNTIGIQMPVLVLTFFWGPGKAGLYALGLRVIETPMRMVGQAIGQVFFSSAADAYHKGNLAEITDKIVTILVQCTLPVMLLFLIIGPELLSFVFGDSWRESGIYAQYLSPWLFLVFVGSPLSILPSVLEKQQYEFIFKVILMVGRTLMLFLGAYKQNIFLAVGLFSCFSTVCFLMYMNWTLSISGNKPLKMFYKIIHEILKALALIAPVIIVKYVRLFPSGQALILSAACLSLLLIVVRTFFLLKKKSVI